MYEFKINIDATEHDAFVRENEYANLLQSSSWAKVKENWGHELVGVYENGKLVASALVLIKQLPLGFTMLYTPRGPIMDYSQSKLVTFFLSELKKYAKTKRALFVKMDPTIHYSDFYLGDEQVKNGWVDKKIDALVSAGAKWQGLTLDMGDTIQPRFQANVHQKDFSEDQFSKKTRQMLRTARNKGIVTRKVGLEGVEEFARLMELTEERKGVKLRSGEHGNYYRTLLETYGDNAFILLAELNLKDLYEKTLARFNENEAAIAKLKDNQVKKRHNLEEQKVSLTREVTELKEKVERLGEKVIIAGTLTIVYGHTSEILYAGMDDDYKRYMPAYLTWFDTIAEAFNMGARTSNMGGLDGHLNDGLLQFKNNFHPVIEEFAGEFDLPVNKLFFKFSETAYKIRKHKK